MRTIINNANIFDGSGSDLVSGSVAIEDKRIVQISDAAIPAQEGDIVIDAKGKTLMPGMVEAHAHLTWPTSVEKFVPGMFLPPEELALTAARNARILLDHGFTSAYSAGALSKTLEISLNEHLVTGGLPGPRLIPSSVEREPPNESDLDPGHVELHSRGPEGVKEFVKDCADIGAKAIKFLISGESALKPGASLELLYTEEELMAAGEQAKESNVWLTGHAHACDAVKFGIKAGFRILYHCTYADDEAIDMLVAKKDEMFVAPTIGIIQATLDANPPPHMDMTHMKEDAAIVLSKLKALVPKLKAKGVRILPGGDYGFPFNPNGRNARDLELWVEHFGYTPAETLHAATQLGGQLMGMGDELGLVKEGYLADLLLIDGDPTKDVTIMQNKQNIAMIMQEGRLYKTPARESQPAKRKFTMYDVAIIGCGPVGALAANFLGKRGLDVVVLEKEANPYPLPRAVHLDHEMVRLFQSVGLHDTILKDMRDTDGHLHIGADHGVIRYMGTVGKPRPYGWSNDYFFYQPELEDHLRNALSRFSNVSLRLGTECVSISQQTDTAGKRSVTLETRTGDKAETVQARWVIACDGARSVVRKSLGIKLDDLQFEEPWLVVDAEVEGEIQFPPLTGLPDDANIQQLSVMMCDPERPATVVPGRGNHRRWELMLLPGEDDQEMMQPEKVAELLAPYLKGVPHNIVRAATYRFHGLVAEQWKCGNVFLAGDAAHQTPPFFGQGMCHGFRDVANLAWKLDLVSKGLANESLLKTYQPERDPHVRAVISAAVGAGRYICMLDREKAAQRDIDIREKVKKGELPTTAADLIPPVTDGIIAAETSQAGRRFIQPRLNINGSEQLFDDLTHGDWRLLVSGLDVAGKALTQVKSTLPDLNIEVVDLSQWRDPQLSAWFEDAGVGAVLLRPDYYVYGTASECCASLLQQLRHQLDGACAATLKQESIA